METKRHTLFHSFSRKLIAVVLGLSMVMSATVLTASQTPAAAQSDGSTTMLLFDLSSSMNRVNPDGRTRLQVAQQAMIDAVGGVAPGSQDIGIRSFSDCGVSRLEHAPAPVNAASLALTINALQIGYRTDISLALSSVAGDFPASGGRKSVILLSDGEHTCGGDPCDTARNLVASGVDIIVHAIGIGTAGTTAENQLACIASVTGGTVISVDRPDQLFRAIDTAIKGTTATTAIVQTAVPTCANSPLVQDDVSLGAMTIGSTFVDDIGTTRLLIIGDDCAFGCNNGFDANCDGELGDFCNSDFDVTTVNGIRKCTEELEGDEDEDGDGDDDGAATPESVDDLLERFCTDSSATDPVAMTESCALYRDAQIFQSRADTARAEGDPFLFNYNQTLAEPKFDEARAALAKAIADLEAEGADYETALASITGDWSNIDGGDPANWDDDELRLMLETLDINVDRDTLALRTASGVPQLLDAVPDWLQAQLFSAGREVQVNATALSASFPPGNFGVLSPATLSGDVTITGETKLTKPQPGVGFTSTQKFELTSEIRMTERTALGKPAIFTTFKRLEQLERLGVRIENPLQRLLNSSRILKAVGKIPFSAAWGSFVGGQMKWETTVTEAQAARGPNQLPNPYDPGSFQVGNSVFIRGGALDGEFFEAKFKYLGVPWRVDSEVVNFSGLGWGITRLDANRFALFSGPVEAFESDVFAGIQKGIIIGVAGNKDLGFGNYRYAEVDLSTQGGEAAYLGFAQGLGVPVTDGPGVRTATFEEITFERELGFELELGFIQGRTNASTTSAVHTMSNYADGYQETTAVYSYPGAQVSLTAPTNDVGLPDTDALMATFFIADVNKSRSESMATAFGESMPAGENFDLQITMTGAELAAYVDLAQEWMAEKNIQPLSDAVNDCCESFTVHVGSARSIEEAVYVFTRQISSDPTNFVVGLAESGIDLAYPEALGGDVEFRPTS